MDCVLNDCSACLEYLNQRHEVTKKEACRKAKLSLNRNEFSEIVLCVDGLSRLPNKYVLNNVKIHCKFIKEGKSTLQLHDQNVRIMLSNCPPESLKNFLKVLSVKLTHFKSGAAISARKKMMLCLPKQLDYISPLNEKDIAAVNKKRQDNNKKTEETRKRKQPLTDTTNSKIDVVTEPPTKKRDLKLAENKLDTEQLHVINIIKQGKSIFFTGSAGTGKSYLLRQIVGMLPPAQTVVTASTGVAACHIGGMTLHSFAGIGQGSENIATSIQIALSRKNVVKQWKACKYLIVDEISMIDGDYFDKIEAVARACRKNSEPFGGIQLILCGDFFQLPPVSKGKGKKKLCFQSLCWPRCVEYLWELKVVYRQSDKQFIRILQDIRIGKCDSTAMSVLKATRHNRLEKDNIVATKLCTHRENVDQTNSDELERLESKPVVFEAQDSNDAFSSMMDKLLPDTKSITLKVGTQVMLTKNLDVSKGLVNGARGVITTFKNSLPEVRFLCGTVVIINRERFIAKISFDVTAVRRQLPLKLAWAISIHKSQGMSLDCVEMSLSRVFENGQAYVALSRARSLKGLRVLDFERTCVRSNVDVLRFYRKLRENQSCQIYHKLVV
uniref:ATP-dependent DNA helicase PIF1 n=1 Tax=Phallusia mammillata TaxID=59560 RepID=A0A6F9DPF2_9ASCI|nr:ATP-dependent DNA helicase PIF1-like [Phallusia mammillata]